MPPDYHIIDEVDQEMILEYDPMIIQKRTQNIDSIVEQSFKNISMKLRIRKNDSFYAWPESATKIYEIIKERFGPELIDSLKFLTNRSAGTDNQGIPLGIRKIEMDTIDNRLELEFVDEKFTEKSDANKFECPEGQIKLLNKKLDSLLKMFKIN